jgi:hypothetical protein
MQTKIILSFLKKHTFLLTHCGLFVLLFFLFYNKQTIIDTNLDLIINPKSEFTVFATGWYSNLYLGISNAPVFSYIFPFGFLYWFLSLFFSIHIVQALIFSFVLFSAFFSFTIFIQEELTNRSFYTYIGSLFYIFNLYTLITFGTSSFLFPYAFLPLQLFFLRKILTSRPYLQYVVGFAFATLMMSGVNPPLVAINIIVICFYLLHLLLSLHLWKKYKEVLVSLLSAFVVTVLLNFYWILGVVVYYTTLSTVGFAAVLSEPLSMQNASSTFLNIFRSLGVWSFSQGWADAPYYNYAPTYLFSPFFQFSLYCIPLFVLIGIAIHKEKVKEYSIIFLLMLFAIAMAVGSNQGFFGAFYLWAYDNIPLFSMFRSSYKFVSVYAFTLSFFLPLLLLAISERKRTYISLLLVIVILVNAFPFFTGRVFEKNKQFGEVPAYYYQTAAFFQKDKEAYRILLLPEQYFAVYNWGFTAGNVETIWNKPLVVRQAGSALDPSNKLTLSLYSALSSRDYKKAGLLFKQLNIKYIVQRNDYNWKFYKDISHSPQIEQKTLQPYKKVATIGELDIYKVPDKDVVPVVFAKNVTFQKVDPTTYRLDIKHLMKPEMLTFLESYNKDWKLYIEQYTSENWCKSLHFYTSLQTTECLPGLSTLGTESLSYLFKPPLFEQTHREVASYANSWIIDPQIIQQNYSNSNFKKNSDGSINVEMTLVFRHQLYLILGLLITGITGIISLSYLVYIKGRLIKR